MKDSYRRYRHFFIFWPAYLVLECYLEYLWLKSTFPELSVLRCMAQVSLGETLLMLVKIPFTHLFIHTIQSYLRTRSNKFLIQNLIVLFVAAIFHRCLVDGLTFPFIYNIANPHPHIFGLINLTNSFLDLIFVGGIGLALHQYIEQRKWTEKEKELTRQKLEMELEFLRAQTNPHFLFNTLNNIYALIRKNPERSAAMVMKLSVLLRYMLYETNRKRIALAGEIEAIENYIELERIRYSSRLNVVFDKQTDNDQVHIAPLVLLPFVENAFKHGASESRFDIFINIQLRLSQKSLVFSVKNSREEGEQGINDANEGIGLRNIKRQLELTYPKRKLNIIASENEFYIYLELNLNENA